MGVAVTQLPLYSFANFTMQVDTMQIQCTGTLYLRTSLILAAMYLLPLLLPLVTGCPSGCDCPEPKVADCSGLGLLSIPHDIGPGIEYLDLSRNKIKKVDSDTFLKNKAKNLSMLIMDYNEIEVCIFIKRLVIFSIDIGTLYTHLLRQQYTYFIYNLRLFSESFGCCRRSEHMLSKGWTTCRC